MTELEQFEQAIAHMERQRAILGDAITDASTPQLRGERRLVTVMFADTLGCA